ncbi:unnamed protein product, partial [Vitis vinifera]
MARFLRSTLIPYFNSTEIAHDFPPFLRAYTDGRVERFFGTDVVPPSVDSETGVSTKDPSAWALPTAPHTTTTSLLFLGQGPEAWLNDHSDFKRVFLAGDSAGANIAHNMAARAGVEGLGGVKLSGICLLHPYFGRREADCVDNRWLFVCPTSSGINDPIINPASDQNLRKLGCSKVLVCVAEKDGLRKRGWFYYEVLGKSGWGGALEIVETEGEDHVFFLFKPGCEKAVALMKRLASFMNQD